MDAARRLAETKARNEREVFIRTPGNAKLRDLLQQEIPRSDGPVVLFLAGPTWLGESTATPLQVLQDLSAGAEARSSIRERIFYPYTFVVLAETAQDAVEILSRFVNIDGQGPYTGALRSIEIYIRTKVWDVLACDTLEFNVISSSFFRAVKIQFQQAIMEIRRLLSYIGSCSVRIRGFCQMGDSPTSSDFLLFLDCSLDIFEDEWAKLEKRLDWIRSAPYMVQNQNVLKPLLLREVTTRVLQCPCGCATSSRCNLRPYS